jgi:dTDP-4-dehydrorhamnose reductase
MSTDCVYPGDQGMYVESDPSDAKDLYGRSKFLGEVDYPNALTLRTSIIGHELDGCRSLVGWFLSQSGIITGYTKAIFSGLPTVEIARIIRDFILPNPSLRGLYHVSADPINKYDLLCLVAKTYGKDIDIRMDDKFVIDRSLDSSRFRKATGYLPKPWTELVASMKDFG